MILSETEKHGEGELTLGDVGTPGGRVVVCVWVVKPERRTLTLDRHDELGDNRQDPGPSVLQHVMDPLAGEHRVRMSGLA